MAGPVIDPNAPIYPDGTAIPPDKIAGAMADGTIRWQKGAQVHFVAPDGQGFVVPSSSAYDAINKGWRPVSPEEAAARKAQREGGTFGGAAAATGLGALRTLTFGGSDVAAEAAGYGKDVATLERNYPIASGVGAIGGLVAPWGVEAGIGKLGLGGARAAEAIGAAETGLAGAREVSAVGTALRGATAAPRIVSRFATGVGERVAGLLPETAPGLRRVVSGAVSGGLEGSAYGASQELSREALGDEQYSIEKILASGAEGGLLGIGVGGVVSGIGVGLRAGGRGVSKLLNKGEPGELSTAERLTTEAYGVTKAVARDVGPERLKLFARDALDKGLIDESVVKSLAEGLEGKAAKLKAATDKLGSEIESVYTDVDAIAQKAKPTWPQFLEARLGQGAKSPHIEGILDSVPGMRAELEKDFRGLSTFNSEPLLANAAKQIGELRGTGAGPNIRAAEKIENDWLPALRNAKTFKEAHDLDVTLRKEIESLKNSDKPGAAALQRFREELKGGLREEVAKVAPAHAEKLFSLDRLYSAYAPISSNLQKVAVGEAVSPALTPFEVGAGAGSVAYGSAAGVLGTVAKVTYRNPRVKSATARFLDNMRKASDKKALELSKAIEQGATKGAHKTNYSLAPKSAALLAAYSDRQRRARETVDNPPAAADRLARRIAPLAAVDPRLAANATATSVADDQWLAARAPQALSMAPLGLAVKGAPPSVPESLAASFNRTVEALDDPFRAVAAIARGAMTPETPVVLKERRPGVLEAASREFDRMTVQLAQEGKVAPYTFRVQASLATGKAYDKTMDKSAIALFQAVHAGRKARQAETLPGVKGGGGRGPQKGAYRSAHKNLTRFRTGAEDNMTGLENE